MKTSNVITGFGALSALGSNVSDCMNGLRLGHRNVSRNIPFSTSLNKLVFQVQKIPDVRKLHKARTLSLTLAAVDEALQNAELTSTIADYRVGVCVGTTVASQLNDIEFYRELRATGAASSDSIERYLQGNLAEAIAKEFGAKGPRFTVVNACSSGSDAIGIAMSWLNADKCDIVIAGGADELNRVPMAGFNALGVYSDELCSPFDKDRSGLNLGEGAGIIILEKSDIAQERGADTELYCAGYATYADAYHLTAPRPDGSGLIKAIDGALQQAGIGTDDIAFVNAHGTGTASNDLVEGNAIFNSFGKDCKIYSSKGYTGHTLGAAGALEAIFTAKGLLEGWIPASAGFVNSDDAIAIDPVSETTLVQGKFALSTSLAFGGNNTALIIGRRTP